jgi:hypothetical protein
VSPERFSEKTPLKTKKREEKYWKMKANTQGLKVALAFIKRGVFLVWKS